MSGKGSQSRGQHAILSHDEGEDRRPTVSESPSPSRCPLRPNSEADRAYPDSAKCAPPPGSSDAFQAYGQVGREKHMTHTVPAAFIRCVDTPPVRLTVLRNPL